MTKIEISTILEDNGFIYDIESKEYCFKYDSNISACFIKKEYKKYYNEVYYFKIKNNENIIEIPCSFVEKINFYNNKKTEKLKFTVYTNFDTFIMTTFRYKAALYDIHDIKLDLENIKDNIEESLSGINEMIDKLKNPYEDE